MCGGSRRHPTTPVLHTAADSLAVRVCGSKKQQGNWRKDSEHSEKNGTGKLVHENAAEVEVDTKAGPDEIGRQDESREYVVLCNLLASIATCVQKLASRIRPTQETFTERRRSRQNY